AGLQGVQVDKVWIYGNLRVATSNNPRCEVRWGWHVAPTLLVDTGGGHSDTYVIDPSLFPGPVPRATWAGVQGDPNAVLVPTAGSVFYRSAGGAITTDPSFAQSNAVLDRYRNELRIRATGADGPPPYLNCLPARPGVQFYGAVAPGATHSWFTFGWPAHWHVLWTVMPLTTCPGAAQLKWRTRIERASATAATYWIVVTNLSNATVRFEARYDVLSR
ncbi:MAG TPA: protein-glutamine glutaminase family protein, partial [Rubrivivax sp.]|nr:protein-glutamine glutaminase family protein [Rubrivivax sp.]